MEIDGDSFVIQNGDSEIRVKRLDIAEMLQSILEKKLPLGIFVCVRPDQSTKDKIQEFFKGVDVPDLIAPSEYHVTMMYDKNHDPQDFDIPKDIGKQTAKFAGYALYGQEKDCLVMKLESKGLEAVFERLKGLGMEHSYPEFSPHLTLSYKGGKVDISKLPEPTFEFSFLPDLEVEEINDDYKSKVKTA